MYRAHYPARAIGVFVNSPATYWRTVRHLRHEQIFGRLRRLVPTSRPSREPAPSVRSPTGTFGKPILRHGPIRSGSVFRFLNRQGAVERTPDWMDERHSKLWLYNLHYFD